MCFVRSPWKFLWAFISGQTYLQSVLNMEDFHNISGNSFQKDDFKFQYLKLDVRHDVRITNGLIFLQFYQLNNSSDQGPEVRDIRLASNDDHCDNGKNMYQRPCPTWPPSFSHAGKERLPAQSPRLGVLPLVACATALHQTPALIEMIEGILQVEWAGWLWLETSTSHQTRCAANFHLHRLNIKKMSHFVKENDIR